MHMMALSSIALRKLGKAIVRRGTLHVFAIMVSATACGCSNTYETDDLANPLAPDLQDDTAPAPTMFDPSLDYQGRFGVENQSIKRFRFDVMPYADDAERQRAETLYRSHADFLMAQSAGSAFPSVQTIGTYTKQLDDTIYAGVERAVEDGLAPTLEPKRSVLRGVVDYLSANRSPAGDQALATVAAALILGGDSPTYPADLAGLVESIKSAFLANPGQAKPIGFYTWSAELTRI